MNLGALVVRLLLERAQFRTELAQTVQETNAAASKVQGHAATITGAVTDAVNGQTTAVQTATRALSVLGPVAATATAAALAVGLAYHQAQQETLAYEKAIILSGNAAGVTSGQLADMARRIDGVAGTQANAAAALASMTAGGKVAQENLEKVALAAIEMERATGRAIGETEKIFSSLGKDPVKASLRLNESMNYLTASTYAQMKAAEDLGDKEAAASIAQNAAADALRDRAGRVEQQLGLLERAWRGVRDVAKEAWDNMLNVGRPDTLSTQIAAVRQRIAQARGEDPNRRFSTPFDTPLAELEQQLAYLTEQERMIRRGTEAQAERNRVQSAGVAAVDALGKANERAMSRQEQAAKALDAYRENLKAVRAAYEQAPSDALAKLLDPAVIEKAEAAIRKQGETVARTTKAALSEYDKLMQRLGTDVPKAAAEAEAAQHGYNKAQTEFLALAGSPAWAKFTNEQRASAAAQFEKKIASEQAADAIKAEEKATVEATKAREKSLATAEKELEKLRASVVAQEEQNARLGLSKEAIAELDAAKLEMLATDAEMQAANALFLNQNGELFLVLQKQAKAYRDLAQAKRDGAAKQVDVDREKQIEDAAGKAAKEGEKAAERIEQSLTDSLMRGFESGKDFAKNLRDTVVNMFKTMVLRPVISAIINPISQGITGMMGLSGAAQAGQGASALGGIGNIASLASGIGSFTTAGMLPGAMATALTGSTSSLAMGLSGAWGAGGGMLSTLNAGMSMMGSGSIMSGLGTIAGALGPIAIGIALIAALVSKKPTPHMGAASTYSEATGLVSGSDVYAQSGFADLRTYNAGVEQVTGNVAKAIGDTLNSTAKAFGQTAGYEITTAFADDTSKDGAWGSLIIKQLGESVLDWRDTQTSKWAPREFADGEAGSKEYLAEVAKSARDALVQAIGSVDWATDMLKGLGDTVSLESLAQTVQQINAAKAAFVGFGQYMPAFASLADSAVSKIVQASGGVDALAGNMSVFVDGFYTDAEKLAINTENVRAAMERLGFEMPATRDEFKALVQAQIALGDAGAKTAAGLLGLSGAFASVTQSAEEAAAMARASAEKARSSALAQLDASVQRERALWTAQADAAASLRDEVQGIFDTLATNIRDLRNEGMGEALSAAQGRVFIASAQAAVQAGAGLPDNDALADAIAAARGGIAASGAYGNSIEREFAALALAGELAVLQEAAGEQLSTAELQLRAAESQIEQLDETLVYWRKLIDGTNAGIDATLSVADAVRSLQGLMFPEAEQPDAPAPGSSGGFSIGGGGGGGGAPAPAAASLSRLGNTYLGAGGTAIVDRDYIDRFDSINQFVNTLDFSASGAAASVAALSSAALQYGASANEIAIATGYRLEDVEALLSGIPRYKRGTNYVPEDGLAFLHKGEQVLPVAPQGAPYQPPMADNSQVVALLQQIAQRVAALESHASTSADANTQTADVLTRASQGDALTTAAAPTIA